MTLLYLVCEVVTIFIKRLKEKAKEAIEKVFGEFVMVSFIAIGGVLVCGIFILLSCLIAKLAETLFLVG